jgi:hypothetical protein
MTTKQDELTTWIFQRDRTTGCWEWPYSLTAQGYGQLRFNGGPWTAHRAAALLAGLDLGAFICHHCDNRKCCNPSHLYAGDVRTNAADAVDRGRVARGEQVSRLTEDQVRAIRSRPSGVTQRSLAAAFGVNPQTVNDIVKGRTWGWLA